MYRHIYKARQLGRYAIRDTYVCAVLWPQAANWPSLAGLSFASGPVTLECCSVHPRPGMTDSAPGRRRSDQVMQEVSGFLKMMGEVYGIFGLDYEMALSTRPESYLGEIETWNKAEASLTDALNSTGREWKVRTPSPSLAPPAYRAIVLLWLVGRS